MYNILNHYNPLQRWMINNEDNNSHDANPLTKLSNVFSFDWDPQQHELYTVFNVP